MKISDNLSFLRYCLDTSQDEIPKCVSAIDWHALYLFAKEQAIVSIYWMGIKNLANVSTNQPSDSDIMEWMGASVVTKEGNIRLNKRAAQLTEALANDGFASCVLKGQGNALMYPDPMSRNSGDIDIWVTRRFTDHNIHNQKDDVKATIAYCKQHGGGKYVYHHIDCEMFNDVEVEVHYRPSWASNPIHNKRLQKFFWDRAEIEMKHRTGKGFNSPTAHFNIIYQLSHIYHHVLQEGIGLRQFIDYYYLLKSADLHPSEISQIRKDLKSFGLMKIARAVSWILSNILGLDESYLIVKPDRRLGKMIFHMVLEGGNFGKYSAEAPLERGTVRYNVRKLKRDVILMRYFPEECVCEPFFRLWHYFWRRKN